MIRGRTIMRLKANAGAPQSIAVKFRQDHGVI